MPLTVAVPLHGPYLADPTAGPANYSQGPSPATAVFIIKLYGTQPCPFLRALFMASVTLQ